MKSFKTFYVIWALSLVGCSSFRTVQIDERTDPNGEKTKITTKASSRTFFDSKSNLAKWKATQTERSQGAEVGNLSQESHGTNVASLVEAVASGVVQGLGKTFIPKP